jgi:hypothetical protein
VRLLKEVQIADAILKDVAEKKLPCQETAERQIGLTGCHLLNESRIPTEFSVPIATESDRRLAKAILSSHSNNNGILPTLGHCTLSWRDHILRLQMKSVSCIFIAATKCRSSLFLSRFLPRSARDNELVILIESACPVETE